MTASRSQQKHKSCMTANKNSSQYHYSGYHEPWYVCMYENSLQNYIINLVMKCQQNHGYNGVWIIEKGEGHDLGDLKIQHT